MIPIMFVCVCVFFCFVSAASREARIDEIIHEERLKKTPLDVQAPGAIPGEVLEAMPSALRAPVAPQAPPPAPVIPTQLRLELHLPGTSYAASSAPMIESLPLAEFDVAHTSYDDLEPLVSMQESHWVH